MIDYLILEINDSNIDSLEMIAKEATEENYSFVRKTIDEWKSGVNNFSKKGEKLWGIFINNKCIAIGGLNKDPYIDDKDVGRVRHVYVSKEYRGQGLSIILLKLIISEAKKNFKSLRLSTHNPIAASLYESNGFNKVDGVKVTHEIKDLGEFKI